MAPFLPDWQVFVRHPDGRGRYFVFSRRRQAAVVAAFSLILLWAAISTMILFHRPKALAEREHRLEAQAASFHVAEQRLAKARAVVTAMTSEVQAVHANLVVLAKSSGALTKDHVLVEHHPAPDPAAKTIDKIASKMAGKPGGRQVGAMREDLNRLQASLDRLEETYGEAVRNTAHIVNEHIAETEHPLKKLGINTRRLVAEAKPYDDGEGGPFIPLSAMKKIRHKDVAMTHLLSQMQHWYRLKGMLRTLPLGEPIHVAWRLDSPFGARTDPINGEAAFHPGIDMGDPVGTKIYATAPGRVILAQWVKGYGRLIAIDNGDGFSTRYAHLSRFLVHVGEHVTRSTVIGLLGDTGRSTGPHLHYEVRVDNVPRNPLNFIRVGLRDASETR